MPLLGPSDNLPGLQGGTTLARGGPWGYRLQETRVKALGTLFPEP